MEVIKKNYLMENKHLCKESYSNKKRNYGIDLFKMLATIKIVILHFNLHSKLVYINHSSHKFKEVWCLEILSFWGVDGFGLISGFVGYKKHKFSNLLYIWIEVLFYSVFLSLILFFTKEISYKEVIFSFFPILIKRHWYVNAYIFMYLLLPFINEGIKNINKTTFRNIIIFFVLFFSIYQTIAKIFRTKGFVFLNEGFSIFWLTVLYIIGAYIGKYEKNETKKSFCYFFALSLIYLFFSFITALVYFNMKKYNSYIPNTFLINYLSPTILFQAISLLLLFSKLNISNKYCQKIIDFFNPLNFSVILIHGRIFLTKNKLTKFLFNPIKNYKGNFTFLIIYLISIAIYLICTLMDYLRLYFFNLLKIRYFCELIFMTKKTIN